MWVCAVWCQIAQVTVGRQDRRRPSSWLNCALELMSSRGQMDSFSSVQVVEGWSKLVGDPREAAPAENLGKSDFPMLCFWQL